MPERFAVMEPRGDGDVRLATCEGRLIVDTRDNLAAFPFNGGSEIVPAPPEPGNAMTCADVYAACWDDLRLPPEHPFRDPNWPPTSA